MRTLLINMLFFSTLTHIVAQNCEARLTGTVTDYHDKTVLEGASILIIGTQTRTYSTKDGSFVFNGICKGSYELEVTHPACATLIIPVTINGDTALEIKLEHHLEELEEVNIVGDAIRKKTNSALEESLKLETLESYSAGSLGDALKELTGISSLNTGANIVKPIIHGLNGSRVLILNDGVRMQDMEWGDEHAPNIDINSAGTISVIKGASALQYGGDAIGGVIVMEQTKVPSKDTLYGKTLLNGISNGRGGSISSELSRAFNEGWFIKGQGSYKRLGNQEAPDYILSNTGVREVGASLQFGKHQFVRGWDVRYSYYNAEIAILRASHIGNNDDLIRAINSSEPLFIRPFIYDLLNPKQDVTHHLGKFKFYRRFEGLGRLNFQYDFQSNRRFEFDIRRGDRDNRASLDLELTTHTLTSDFKWDAKENSELHFGILGRYQENFPNPDTGVRRLIPDYDKYDFGAFIIGEFRFNTSLLVEAGIRYDFNRIDAQKFYITSRWEERGYDRDFQELIVENRGTQLLVNPVFDYHNISSTLGAKFILNDGSLLKVNYALAQRPPNPSELFSDGLHHSAARIELGDLRIGNETSHKITTSLEKNFANWGFVIEPYANWVKDFILLEPTGVELSLRGAFPVWEYRQTDARLLGIDLSAYANWTPHWTSEHKFSLVKGNDVENDIALINIPAANLRNSIIFSKAKWNDFELILESQYVFRQNEFPDNIMVFSPEQQQEVLLEINTPPGAYHLLELQSKVGFPLGKTTELTTSLRINNIMDTTFRDYLSRQRFFADDLGRNVILQVKLNY